jgi:hypothetical protein
MRAVQLLVNRAELPLLELADLNPAAPLGGPDDGRVHQLQHRAFPERVRKDLGSPALFEEQALQKSGRANDLPVRSGKRRWAMHASKSSRKHCTTAGASRS